MSFYTFLPKILNMSLTASVAIIFVLLLRLLLKKAPKVISYALWGVVLIRLLCPVSIESGLSLFGLFDTPTVDRSERTSAVEYIPSNIVHTEFPSVVLPVPGIGEAITETLPQGEEQLRADPLEGPIFIATYVWWGGILVMAVYGIVTYLRLRRRLITASPLRDNIYLADDIDSPFVMGLIRPKIYLPSEMEEREQSYIILHEQHHIRRLDHIVKALAFVALCIHWFNPLVWVAFILSGKDMEMSCDEAVVRKLGTEIRADYTASLLSLATGKRIIAGMPLAFGEGNTKDRIKNLANWKKPAFWVVLVAVIACVVLAVCLLTNPSDDELNAPEPFGHRYRVAEILNEAPRFSFTYTVETAPRYQFTSDYVMSVSGDALDTHESDSWLRVQGVFEEVKITTENFDNYFDMDGWHVNNAVWSEFRSTIKKAWRIDVEDDENNAFYYVFLTSSDEVYLSYGYDEGDNSLIRWLFRLERADLITCTAVSDGINAFVQPAYYPQSDIDRDTAVWPSGEVNESGTLVFTVDHETNALVISEEYYNRQDKANVVIERDTYELGRNEDGKFELPVSCRGSQEDTVKYYIKIKGGPGVYVMEIEFGSPPVSSSAGSTPKDPGMTETEASPVKWTYSPMMSATWHAAFHFNFNLANYSHIEASCDNGTLWNLRAQGQPRDKAMRFELGEPLCWMPGVGDSLTDTAENAKVTFTVYDGGEIVAKGVLDIVRTGTENGQSFYEAQLTDTQILALAQEPGNLEASVVMAGNGYMVSYSDFNHNRINERVIVREMHPGMLYELCVVEDGTVIWSTEASPAHTGWNTIMHYEEGGKSYLVEYQPSMFQGAGSYRCTVFSINGGEKVILREWSVDFELPTEETPEMERFAKEVELLLRKSTVLLSTEQGILVNRGTEASSLPQLYPVRFEPDEIIQAIETAADPTAPQELTVNAAAFPTEPLELVFASGAGAWGTYLTLQPDGSFTGEYGDSDMDTRYECKFEGLFTDVQQISDYCWAMILGDVTVEKEEGTTWTEGGIHYIAAGPHGISDGTTFLLYAPGTPADLLPAACRDWWPDAYHWRNGEQDLLNGWALCNLNEGTGFYTSWLS